MVIYKIHLFNGHLKGKVETGSTACSKADSLGRRNPPKLPPHDAKKKGALGYFIERHVT